jgi:hypothetical protein
MKRYTEMLKIMTVLPGNPTVYAGDELVKQI